MYVTDFPTTFWCFLLSIDVQTHSITEFVFYLIKTQSTVKGDVIYASVLQLIISKNQLKWLFTSACHFKKIERNKEEEKEAFVW